MFTVTFPRLFGPLSDKESWRAQPRCARPGRYEIMKKEDQRIAKRHTKTKSQGYRRACITYKVDNRSEHTESIHTCELDGLSVLDLSSKSSKLFSFLSNIGITCKLISHFAECERLNQQYTALFDKRVLFHRDLCQASQSLFDERGARKKEFTFSSLDSSHLPLVNHYRLSGGMSSCHWIVEHDPDFFKSIYKGVLRGFCTIRRLATCTDHSEDFMSWLSQDIKSGCVNAFKSHLRGSGVSKNVCFENQSIGPRSVGGKDLRSCPNFYVNALYCGEPRTSSCVVVFHDGGKDLKKDLSIPEGLRRQDKTRIELVLFPRSSQTQYVELANMLLYTMTLPRDDGRGQYVRHVIFTVLLFSRIVFTRSAYNKTTPFNASGRWSYWYRRLFKAYMSYCIQTPENEFLFPYSEASILPLLSDCRTNPNSLVTVCKNLLVLHDYQLSKQVRSER